MDIKNRVVRSDYPYDTVLNFAVTVLEGMSEGDLRHYHRQYGLLSASTDGDHEFHIPYITLGQILDTDGELVDWSIVVLFNSIIATDDNASKIIVGLNGQ